MQDKEYHALSFSRNARTLTITGNAVRVQVRAHGLSIEDGFKAEGETRTRYVYRAVAQPDRVLLLATSGFATLSALDWCGENNVPIVCCDQSGDLRWALLPGKGGEWTSRLRRAQALAPFTDAGVEVARWLVSRKIEGQRDVLREWGRPSNEVAAVLHQVQRATKLLQFRPLEARAAETYWSAWTGLPVHFAPPSYARRIPTHWSKFTGRGSPLSNGARNAADPVNTLVNYACALVEAEAHIACHEAGFDPYLGILHTDQDARRSLVYDVMEPVRPVADRLVLNLVRGHAFRPGELWSLRDGRCRLDQDLCARLWPWMPTFRKALGPVMTFLVSRLRHGVKYGERVGRTGGRRYWASEVKPVPLRPAGICRSCGVLLEGITGRSYCDACLSARRRAATKGNLRAGTDRLRQLRLDGRDPAHGGIAAKARKERLTQNRERVRAWERVNTKRDPAEFNRAILPGLQRVTLGEMMRATGLCSGYCAMIRKGKYIPHPRHWETLRGLVRPSVPPLLLRRAELGKE